MSATPASPRTGHSQARPHGQAESLAEHRHSGAQSRGPKRASTPDSPSILKLAASGMRKFIVIAPLSVVGGLLAVLIANPVITNTYDDPAAARKLFFLAITISILSMVALWFTQGYTSGRSLVVGSHPLLTLLAAGLTRRKIFFYHLLRSALYALATAAVTLLTVLALSVITGDFSGQLSPDGTLKVNLWLLPVLAASGSLCLNWWFLAGFAAIERFRWFGLVAAVFVVLLVMLLVGAVTYAIAGPDYYLTLDSSDTSEFTVFGKTFSNVAFLLLFPGLAIFTKSVLGATAFFIVLLVFIALPGYWFSLRRLPIKK